MAGAISRAAVRSLLHRIVPSLSIRRFAAAAAVDYESDWEIDEEEENAKNRRSSAQLAMNTWGESESRGVQWVFMGSPAAKKHLYANRLAEILDVPYISMATLVRQELDPTSSVYSKIANAVNEGKLVPEDIIFGLLSKRLQEGYHRGESGFILDGIPRTRVQAEILDNLVDVDLVVNFKLTEDSLVKKHFGTHTCLHCGKSFNASNSVSTSFNPCLATRTHHSQMKSSAGIDKEINVQKFHSYSEESKLIQEYYGKQKKLLDFQVSSGPAETWHGLLAALHLQHIDAANVSQTLTI